MGNETISFQATALVSLDPTPVFPFYHHSVEVEYAEFNAAGETAGAYFYASEVPAPSLRKFILHFVTMGYFLTTAGEIDLSKNQQDNLAYLEWFYAQHGTHRAFLYEHPTYGPIKARFAEGLEIPKGLIQGRGYSEGFNITLLEVPTSDDLMSNVNGNMTVDATYVFEFVRHQFRTSHRKESISVPLGNNYFQNSRPSKPEQRTFFLSFAAMRLSTDSLGRLDVLTDPVNNAARLELLYFKVRTVTPFWYFHPVYGPLKVRFKAPLKLPAGKPRGLGYLEPFEIQLVEVMS